ncbi:MAG: helix-turn-helix transcriptional regulator [Clostridiales bacterium]|nr:helix-turn-helix transcriptional regulator [Clostridiales bacterium]
MDDEIRLGTNIRSLRKAYGETQEQLGAVLNVEKTTVSNYENGMRKPDGEMIAKIANHYMVSVEELVFCDLSEIGCITIDNKAFWKSINIVLPIAFSEEAMKNEHFKKAYICHREFYDEMQKTSVDNMDCMDQMGVCFDEYSVAYEDERIEPEVAANLLAIWYFMVIMVKSVPLILHNQPSALLQLAKRDHKVRQIIDNPNPDFEKDMQEIAARLDDPELNEKIDELKTTIKRSRSWSDLADYYLAMQYIWNIVDNDLEWNFNRRVGVEMLNSFASVGNIYAARYIRFCMDSMGLSSQNVDDK